MRARHYLLLIIILSHYSCRTFGTFSDQRSQKSSPARAPSPPRIETLDVIAQFVANSSQIIATLDGALKTPLELKKNIQVNVPDIEAKPNIQIKNPFDLILKILQETGIPKLVLSEYDSHWRWESLSAKRFFGTTAYISLSPEDQEKNITIELPFPDRPQSFRVARLSANQESLSLLNLNEIQRLYIELKNLKSDLPIFELKGLFHIESSPPNLRLKTQNFSWRNKEISLESKELSANFEYPSFKIQNIDIKAQVTYQDVMKGQKTLTLKASKSNPKGMELNFVLE